MDLFTPVVEEEQLHKNFVRTIGPAEKKARALKA
jgi:hypothetical protein